MSHFSSHFSSHFMSVIRRFHGSRCIISNMNNGRDMNAINQIINESNRQKLEARIIELEHVVKQLNEKVTKFINSNNTNTNTNNKINMVPDCKRVN